MAPLSLLSQLEVGGRMIIPLGSDEVQQLSVFEKLADGSFNKDAVMLVRFTRLESAG